MKIIVDKLPEYFSVPNTCIYAKKTGEEMGGKNYSTLEHCNCKISGHTCELQAHDECPYLISLEAALKGVLE